MKKYNVCAGLKMHMIFCANIKNKAYIFNDGGNPQLVSVHM